MTMPESRKIKVKICLVGEGSVGKSSLIRRFVFDDFDDTYVSTIGTKITKKDVNIKDPEEDVELNITMLIWDIMGQKGFRQLLQEAYFYGSHGLIAVCDITNKTSLNELDGWIDAAYSVTGGIPIAFLANKSDLTDQAQFTFEEFKEFVSKHDNSLVFLSSAKTGENVIQAFNELSMRILKKEPVD
jgi:small GTP-binding protein